MKVTNNRNPLKQSIHLLIALLILAPMALATHSEAMSASTATTVPSCGVAIKQQVFEEFEKCQNLAYTKGTPEDISSCLKRWERDYYRPSRDKCPADVLSLSKQKTAFLEMYKSK